VELNRLGARMVGTDTPKTMLAGRASKRSVAGSLMNGKTQFKLRISTKLRSQLGFLCLDTSLTTLLASTSIGRSMLPLRSVLNASSHAYISP